MVLCTTNILENIFGGLPYEKVRVALQEFLFWPLRGAKEGMVQALFNS